MNTRKAALRVGAICLKVAIFIAIVLTIVYMGQTAFRYTHAVFSDAAYEEAPGKTVKVKIAEDISGKKLAEVLKLWNFLAITESKMLLKENRITTPREKTALI